MSFMFLSSRNSRIHLLLNLVVPLPSAPTTAKTPLAILDRKMVKHGRTHATKVLVHWQWEPKEDGTWEFYYDLLQKFPTFRPWGQYLFSEGGIVTNTLVTCYSASHFSYFPYVASFYHLSFTTFYYFHLMHCTPHDLRYLPTFYCNRMQLYMMNERNEIFNH